MGHKGRTFDTKPLDTPSAIRRAQLGVHFLLSGARCGFGLNCPKQVLCMIATIMYFDIWNVL